MRHLSRHHVSHLHVFTLSTSALALLLKFLLYYAENDMRALYPNGVGTLQIVNICSGLLTCSEYLEFVLALEDYIFERP